MSEPARVIDSQTAAADPVEDAAPAGLVLPPGWGVVPKPDTQDLVAICPECEAASEWPAAANGSIQKCPHCEGWLDVGGEDWFEEAESAGTEADFLALLPPHDPCKAGCGCN